MKTQFFAVFMLVAMILAACQPATPVVMDDLVPEVQPTETPAGLVTSGEVFGEGADTGSVTTDFPRPEVIWNPDPNVLIISGTFCCGFTTPLAPLNYIPDFQVWGDGRYVWVVYSTENGSRQVLQGQLPAEQMTILIQRMVDTGFFGWEDRYANELVADVADKCITVNLESASKTVCEYYEGAPEAFHGFYDNFSKGNGLKGTDFVPTRGFLTAFDYGKLARPVSEDDILWPTDQLFSLSTAIEKGVWVEGEALRLAWEAANRDPWGSIVYDGQGFYGVGIQIPGLSMNQPPAETE
ncbi:MAG: hypothetical protein Fur0022_13830 [Anaerolineales bacterium]